MFSLRLSGFHLLFGILPVIDSKGLFHVEFDVAIIVVESMINILNFEYFSRKTVNK